MSRSCNWASDSSGTLLKSVSGLLKAERGDRWGNLVYRKTARNFGPIMATAARCTVVQVNRVVELGELDPEIIVTPGIYVKRIVHVPRAVPATGRAVA